MNYLIVIVAMLALVGAAVADFLTFRTQLRDCEQCLSQGSLYISMNPGVFTKGVEALLNDYDTKGYFQKDQVFEINQRPDIHFDDIKGANFYWVSISDKGHKDTVNLKNITITNQSGESMSFCGNNEPILWDKSTKLTKC